MLPSTDRPLGEDLSQFPHVNGDLFADQLRFADFNSEMMVVQDAGTVSEGIQTKTSAKPSVRPRTGGACG